MECFRDVLIDNYQLLARVVAYPSSRMHLIKIAFFVVLSGCHIQGMFRCFFYFIFEVNSDQVSFPAVFRYILFCILVGL